VSGCIDARELGSLLPFVDRAVADGLARGMAASDIFVLAFAEKGIALHSRRSLKHAIRGMRYGLKHALRKLLSLCPTPGICQVVIFDGTNLTCGRLEVNAAACITTQTIGAA